MVFSGVTAEPGTSIKPFAMSLEYRSSAKAMSFSGMLDVEKKPGTLPDAFSVKSLAASWASSIVRSSRRPRFIRSRRLAIPKESL